MSDVLDSKLTVIERIACLVGRSSLYRQMNKILGD